MYTVFTFLKGMPDPFAGSFMLGYPFCWFCERYASIGNSLRLFPPTNGFPDDDNMKIQYEDSFIFGSYVTLLFGFFKKY